MGSDLVAAYARVAPKFSRADVLETIIDLWQERGAKRLPARWSRAAADRSFDEDAALLGYAISPVSERGWVAIVESAWRSVRMDKELLSRVAAETSCWVDWSLDHSNLYGAQRISRRRDDEPIDADAKPYRDLRGEKGWSFLAFSGAHWKAHRDFVITERTKTHALPKAAPSDDDVKREAFSGQVRRCNPDAALALLTEISQVDEHMLEVVFSLGYRVEFEEVARCVLRVGSAVAARSAGMSADFWARLLETAAICNDAAVKKQALAGLAAAGRAKAALASARTRLEEAAATKRGSNDGRAAMRPALERFRAWTATSARRP